MRRLCPLLIPAAAILAAGCGGQSTFGPPIRTTGEIRFTVDWPATTRQLPAATRSLLVSVELEGEPIAQRLFLPPAEPGLTEHRIDEIPTGVTVTVDLQAKPTPDGQGVSLSAARFEVPMPESGEASFQATLENEVRSVRLSSEALTIPVGGSETITATARNDRDEIVLVDPGAWEWTGDSDSVRLTPDGASVEVLALARGAALIQARDRESNRTSESARITLCPPAGGVGNGGGGLAASPWPSFRGNARASGSGVGCGETEGQIRWLFASGAAIESSPTIGPDGTVFFGSNNGQVFALDGQTGDLKWKRSLGGPVKSSPAIGANGSLYVGAGDGSLHALDAANGTPRWSFTTAGAVDGSPALGADGAVYFGSRDGRFYALDGADGTERWRFQTGAAITGSPAISEDGTVYIGSGDGSLYALNGATGVQRWRFLPSDLFFTIFDSFVGGAALSEDGLVFIGAAEGTLYALDAASGEFRWRQALGEAITGSPAVGADGEVAIGIFRGGVFSFDATTGVQRWRASANGDVQGSPSIGADGTVTVGSHDRRIYAFDGATGAQRWRLATGNVVVSSPAFGSDGTVYIGSTDGILYAVR
ncbi:MAG: PQQ-binding-like beta-propeller repeat protein [Fimbriimonadaceae bacterium]|nr:PQQ-binding-like beta-propeller repeat protein [Fimbriimonadaceae bacterium]